MFVRDLRSDFLSLFGDKDGSGWGGGAWWLRPLIVSSQLRGRFGRGSGRRGEEEAAVQPTVETTAIVESAALPSDPLFSGQWHLNNTGQTGGLAGVDVNVETVWYDYIGRGVTIGVIDEGVEYTHPDLAAGMNTALDYDALSGDNDPFPNSAERHGTAVSGMIVAQPDNGIGVAGVAYGAEAASFRMGFGSNTLPQIVDNLQRQDTVDISTNSWAYNGYFFDNFESGTFASAANAIRNAVMTGRDGLGTVFLFAGGNDRASGQNVNYHSFQNSIHTIAVAAIEDDGTYASFSTPGAALLVAAPGEDVLTTDRTGGNGYVSGGPNPDYVTISGTSFATPLTAGVVALMLEANPNLGYRDVQEILAYSARQVDPGSAGWETNGATNWNGGGLHSSHDYGFGLVDAHDAVRLAETWSAVSTYNNMVSVQGSASPNQSIPDGSGSLVSQITLAGGVQIDQIEVLINIDHSWIGDLIVTLTSPDGTESILVNRPGKNPNSSSGWGTSQDDINATLTSTNHWGEESGGTWTLRVFDVAGAFTGRLISWTLIAYGDTVVDDNTYYFTDEFSGIAGTNYLLGDSSGDDTLNAAAVTSNSTIDLDGFSTIAGWGFDTGSQIENAYAGDGSDTIIGNAGNNILMGGRGDDDLFGEGGTDTAKYLGHSSGFTVVTNGAVTTVTDISTAGADADEGTDTLQGIEFIMFSDQTVAVTGGPPVNLPPTGIGLSSTDVDENATGAVIGNVTVTDPNAGDTHDITVDDARFEVVGGVLKLVGGASLDHETEDSVTITLTAEDAGGLDADQTFTIAVNDVNEEPTAIALSSSDVDENAAGAVIGNVTVTDPDDGDTHTITVDDARFEVVGGVLKLVPGTSLDHETEDSVTITLTAEDQGGLDSDQTFTITVNDLNESAVGPISDNDPTAGVGGSIDENAVADDPVGITALAVDPDDGVTYGFTPGGDAGGLFDIDPNSGVVTLAAGAVLDHETATSHSITVLATSDDSSTSTQVFTIAVNDVDEFDVGPVSDDNPAANSVSESAGADAPVGITALATDDDLTDSISYSLMNDAGGRFQIDETSGVVTTTGTGLDHETAQSHDITVKATSDDSSTSTFTFSIAVTDDRFEDPVGPVSDSDGAAGGSIAENAADDDPVGITAFATDPDLSDNVTYSLTNNAGGRFKIDANSGVVTVASAALLDFEAAGGSSHDIGVLATSDDGSTDSATFSIAVTDVNETPFVDGGIGDQSAEEDSGFSFTLPGDAFDDPDLVNGDTLDFAATEDGEAGLPAWLNFDAGTQTFSGTPDDGDVGTVTIRVTVTDDGALTASTTFDLTVDPLAAGPITENGTPGSDTIDKSGSFVSHIINGLGGPDTITGSSANDTITGGEGDDEIMGGPGDDLIFGGPGNDDLSGGAGSDRFVWQAGEGGGGGKNAGIEVSETITDFTVVIGGGAENDVLDIGALLAGAPADIDHVQYVSENSAGTAATDTRIEVDFDGEPGIFDNSFSPTLEITLVDVDLYGTFGVTVGSHQALTDQLVLNGNLIV